MAEKESTIMKRQLAILTVIIIETLCLPIQALAQDASSSAQSLNTPSATQSGNVILREASSAAVLQAPTSQTDSQNPFAESLLHPSGESSSDQAFNKLLQAAVDTPGIAMLTPRRRPIIGRLPKNTFKRTEPVEITVSNADADKVKVFVTDWLDHIVTSFVTERANAQNVAQIALRPLSDSLRPGKYTLHVTDPDGNTSTQDFTWGVLAFNTNKSLYTASESASIALAVLDDEGKMVCDARVQLQISSDTLGIDDTLSTDNGKVTVNPQCMSHALSVTPDYEAVYHLAGVGQYKVKLTAQTKNGTYSIDDSISVVEAVPFDVERVTATRIYPANTYPVIFHVQAHQNFTGTVTEYVPADFAVSQSTNSSIQSYTDSSLLASPIGTEELFGTPQLTLTLPFRGKHPLIQGFGELLTDPQEKAYYEQFGMAGHDGLDYSMKTGTPVLATDTGQVILAGDSAYGTTIVIQHTWGKSYYGHLSKLEVNIGDTVAKGKEIALSGNSGYTTGAHLHFGIKPLYPDMQNGYFGKVNPAVYLASANSSVATAEASVDIATSSAVPQQSFRAVTWTLSLKAGERVDFGYNFKAPSNSPAFYTLGPLTFRHSDQIVFQEARLWQIAVDTLAQTTFYLSSTKSTKITATTNATTSYQNLTAAPASADSNSGSSEGRNNTGYQIILPEVVNTVTAFTGTPPTIPNNTGWIYDTPINDTIPAGNWTFSIKNTGTSGAGGTSVPTVCVWKVSVAGGIVSASSAIGTTLCVDGSTNIQAVTTPTAQTITYPANQVTFSASEYIYVEIWNHTTTKSSVNGGQVTLEVNGGAGDSFTTPAQATGPTLDQLLKHGQWFNNGLRQPFTF